MMKTMIAVKKVNMQRVGKISWSVIRGVLIVGISFLILYPIFVKLSTAVKGSLDLYDPTVYFIPKHFTMDNFVTLFKAVNYPQVLAVTVGITLLLSLLQIASCTLVAYGFARFRFPLQNVLFALVIFVLIIPPQVILLPLYLKFRFFNIFQLFTFGGTLTGIPLTGTLWPFVLLSSTAVAFKNSLYIFMLRQYFKNVPTVLEEAAQIDGCGDFKTFYRIILPGSFTMLMTVFLFSFVWQWNDYYYTQVLAPELPTMSVKMMNLSFTNLGSTVTNMVGSMLQAPKFLLLIAPLIVLYLFTQHFFTESIEKSGIVG